MRIRAAVKKDIPQICQLAETREEVFFCFPKASYPLSEEAILESIETRSDSTVIEIDRHIVAFANFYRWKDRTCSIGNVVVSGQHRGVGIGQRLISHMIELAFSKHSATTVTVSCFNRNVVGLLFYPKLGFQPYAIEQRTDYNGKQVALIHLKYGEKAI